MTPETPSVASQVKFKPLSVMSKLAVNKRMAEIAAPFHWEELPSEGRALCRQIATLEATLTNAPVQFWQKDQIGKPFISVVREPSSDTDTVPSEQDIREAYNAYLEWEANRFLGGAEPVGDPAIQSGGTDGLAGSQGNQQEPA
jgi:hypothetical protein